MREARVDTMKFPIQKWRCVTERGLVTVSDQRLLDTGIRVEVLSAPGVSYKTDEIPIFLGERAVRLGAEKLGLRFVDPVSELEKDCRIAELEAEVEELSRSFDAIDMLASRGYQARKKPGRPKVEAA